MIRRTLPHKDLRMRLKTMMPALILLQVYLSPADRPMQYGHTQRYHWLDSQRGHFPWTTGYADARTCV